MTRRLRWGQRGKRVDALSFRSFTRVQGRGIRACGFAQPAALGSATRWICPPGKTMGWVRGWPSGERPASLRTVTGARWASRSAGTPARSPSPVGFARQPALGALDRNAVTGERIPVRPGCQQFIVQVEAVLGVRDATLAVEVLQPVLGFLRRSPKKHRQARLARWRDRLPSPTARPSSQQNRLSASSGSSGGALSGSS